ncbi:MAG: alcohol dehydrogenase catalytic domain-containing protein [Acidobacteria bacterium]|nr:alcohol dehydrogenase catalytic domain-containing protein [Acidobacteriota bacterium]MCA1627899.1 alcohol dehydrogenase catalytic domain-containing protein [Acidobacteriota bacterium]
MLAVRVNNQQLTVEETAKPDNPDEVLVRVLLSGICNTDLEIARGYAGFNGTIGHEFVGVVEDGELAGRRVVGEINAGCGKCELCRAGDPRHCPTRTVLGIVGRDGAHAEFLQLPAVNLIPVPENIADRHAVFTEPLAAACGILERAAITAGDRVAVIGDGKLGLLCAQVVALTGATVLLVGKHPEKLQIAARRGIETANPEEAVKRQRQFDVVVEASGGAAGFKLALDLLRPRGKLVLKSTFHGSTEIDAARIVVDEISIVGSRCGRFEPALDLLNRQAIDVENLISEEHPLSSGVQAMSRAGASGILKVLLRP